MKKYYSKIETKGLPGGPNEQFTYITGVFSSDVFSTEGYKRNSPDKNNPYNIIPSGNITMEGVDFPVLGIDDLGNSKAMIPGNDYQFPGDVVFETPMYKNGGGLLTKTMKCKNCSWSWKAADGGNDVSTCHKCGGQALPTAQAGGSTPIIVDDPSDPRLHNYLDSLNLYKGHQKQLQLNPEGNEGFVAPRNTIGLETFYQGSIGKDPKTRYHSNVNTYTKGKAERDKMQRKYGFTDDMEHDDWKAAWEAMEKDPEYDKWWGGMDAATNMKTFADPLFEQSPEDIQLAKYYDQLSFYNPAATGYWDTPDLGHSAIMPTEKYLSDAWNPVYAKPVQPYKYSGDPKDLEKYRDKPLIAGENREWKGAGTGSMVSRRTTPDPNRSVVDNLKLMGEDTSFTNRKKLFLEAGLGDKYTGTAEQNVALNKWITEDGLTEPVVVDEGVVPQPPVVTTPPIQNTTTVPNTTTTNTNGTVEVPSWKQVWIDDPESPVGGYWKRVYTGTKIDVSPPIRQAGGPIIVPQGDPRQQAYSDSLAGYNNMRYVDRFDTGWKEADNVPIYNWDGFDPKKLKDAGTVKPVSWKPFYKQVGEFDEAADHGLGELAVFKKPVQPVFTEGSKEAEIVKKQQKLKEQGLYKGKIDGIWGPKSQAAWEQYVKSSDKKTTEETVQDNPYEGENEFLTAEPYEGSTNDTTPTNTNNEQTTQESIVDENEGEGTSWYWGYDSEFIPDDSYPGGGYQKRIKRKIPIEGSAPQYQVGGLIPGATNSNVSSLSKWMQDNNLPKAQTGVGVPATRQDSLDVMNSAIRFYGGIQNMGYKLSDIRPGSDISGITLIDGVVKPSMPEVYDDMGNGRYDLFPETLVMDNATEGTYPRKRVGKGESFIKPIGGNKYTIAELLSAFGYNTKLPRFTMDGRIAPQGTFEATSGYDTIKFPYYDPIAVKPWSMLTEVEKAKRVEKYGTSGTPLVSDKTATIVNTPATIMSRSTPDPKRSVVDNLVAMGEDSSYANRKKLAEQAGIEGYKGDPAQNVRLNEWLMSGKLSQTTEAKPEDTTPIEKKEAVTEETTNISTEEQPGKTEKPTTSTNTNNEQTTPASAVDENEGEGVLWYWGYDSEWIPDDSYPTGGYQKRIKRKIPIEGSAPQYQTGGGTVKGRAATSTRPNQKKQLTTTPKSEKPLTTNEDRILTYKDNADWFDSRAVYSDNPQYDDSIRRGVYSGKYGYNPATQMLYPLKKEDQVEISDEIKNILELNKEKIEERDRVRAMSPEAQEAYRQRKLRASLKAEGRQPITIDEIGGRSNPLLREEDKTGRRPWEGKEGQTLFLTPEETTAYYKDWVAKSMVAVGENPLFYAPGIIAAGPALPALGEVAFAGAAPYFSAPITVAGTTIPGATAGNLINAGFAGHGLYNVGPDAIDFATNPSWEGAGNLAMDALEIAPIAGSAVRGTVEGYNAAKQVANKLGNKYLPNAYKHNPWAFKTNPEAYYRQVSKEAIDDAFINKLIREKGEEVTPENYKKFQSQLKDLAGTNEYKNYEEKYRAMAVANSHGPMPYFQRGELFYGNRPTLKVRKKEIPLKERKVVNLDYLIESNYKPEAFQNSYGYKMNLGNPEEIGSVGVLKPDPNLRSLENFNIYKRDWLKGYKPVDVPKQLPGSPNAPTSWFNGKRQNALLVEQARRSGEAPLPDYMTPYISRRYTPATKQQEIFESFLSPETQEKLRELRTQRFTREGPASNEYQQGGEIIPEDVKNMKAALDKELKAVKNYNLTPAKKNKLIQELYTIYNESVPPKFQLGGPVLSAELQMYKDYITGKDESPEAVKNYDKLNRIHYKKAKANNMSPANYIMTELIS